MSKKDIYYDFETTGLNINGCDIPIDIGAIDSFGNTFQCYIKPYDINGKVIELNEFIVGLTGYTTQFLMENGVSMEEAFKKFSDFIYKENKTKHVFMVAHNGDRFDHIIFKRWMNYYNLYSKYCDITTNYLDTLALIKYKYPNNSSYKLEVVSQQFGGYKQIKSHTALDDARAVKAIIDNY